MGNNIKGITTHIRSIPFQSSISSSNQTQNTNQSLALLIYLVALIFLKWLLACLNEERESVLEE